MGNLTSFLFGKEGPDNKPPWARSEKINCHICENQQANVISLSKK